MSAEGQKYRINGLPQRLLPTYLVPWLDCVDGALACGGALDLTHRQVRARWALFRGGFRVGEIDVPVPPDQHPWIAMEDPMPTDITYAKVGGPPDDWEQLQVRDLDTNKLVDRVVEVDTAAGWCVISRRDLFKPGMEQVPSERLTGRFSIERQPRPKT